MTTRITPLLSGFLAVLALSACAKSLPPGEYSKTHKTTTADGTTVKKTTNTDVYYDAKGNKRVTEETETSKDPKGLLNKSTTKTTKTY